MRLPLVRVTIITRRSAMRMALATGMAVVALSGCMPVQKQATRGGEPAPIELKALPGWAQDDLAGLDAAISRQCAMQSPPAAWAVWCREWAARPLAGESLRPWLEARFVAWPLRDDQGRSQGLITGYFEPLLTGSRERESNTQVPIRLRPADLLTIDLSAVEPRLAGMRLRGRLQGSRVVPYGSRADLDSRSELDDPVLVWVDDPVDAFFLEIQGSGRVQLRDGSLLRVGYADQNGHPYRAIGRTLVERGAMRIDEVTGPSIKAWLKAHPDQAREVMHSNPSVVFFRELPAPVHEAAYALHPPGPPGSLGVPLTGLRSIAVDSSVVPLASLVWLDTRHPVDGQALQRLVAAQDTGGAIAGRVRADVFWGFGPQAEQAAGLMKASGQMWLLWPRGAQPPGVQRPVKRAEAPGS